MGCTLSSPSQMESSRKSNSLVPPHAAANANEADAEELQSKVDAGKVAEESLGDDSPVEDGAQDEEPPPERVDGCGGPFVSEGFLQGLSSAGIDAIPASVLQDADLLQQTHVLFLDRNAFLSLPDLAPFSRLEKLNMYSNSVATVPTGMLPPSLEILELNCNQITTIDIGVFAGLPRLSHLDLCANLLTDAAFDAPAAELSGCPHLRFVDVTSNRLTRFPPALLPLRGVFELRCALNELGEFPAAACDMKSMVALQLAMCSLPAVPEDLGTLKALCMLDLSRNQLQRLPDSFSAGPLRELRLGHNQLTTLPGSLASCTELRIVDVVFNQLQGLPEPLCKLPRVEKLLLHHNVISSLGKHVSLLRLRGHGLKELDLSHNLLQTAKGISIECREFRVHHNPLGNLDQFQTLRALELHASHTGIVGTLPFLEGLEQVHAQANQITSIKWGKLCCCASMLRVLNLACNHISSLPPEIGELSKLQELLLGCNRLEGLPSGCSKLRRLKVLHLGCNSLAEVPAPCLELRLLEWLHLGNNRISDIPTSITRLESLQSLLLNDNLLTSMAVVLPDSLVELDVSHNHIDEIPFNFRIPSGGVYWGNKLKRPHSQAKRKPATSTWLSLGGRKHSGGQLDADPADALPAERRATQMPPKMQPFRMYVHGNPMAVPAPHIMAHIPGDLPAEGEAPRPHLRHPRGSGFITLVDYDGAVWPSEAALHLELLRERRAAEPATSLQFGVAEMQGRKLRMEDAVAVQRAFRGRPDEAFFAVFDGHAGSSDVAEDAAAYLGDEFAKQLGSVEAPDDEAVAKALRGAFFAINERLRPHEPVGGAVAVVVYLRLTSPTSGVLHCANVGDARAVLCCNGVARRISRDFKALDPDEHARIRELGGWVSLRSGGRVCDVLCPCRSLGDFMLEKYIEPLAHVQHERVEFSENPFALLCCDGVWDAISDQEAVDTVLQLKGNYSRGAGVLRDAAFSCGSTDNISALVIDLASVAAGSGS